MDSTSGFEKSGHHRQAEQATRSRQDKKRIPPQSKEQESNKKQESKIGMNEWTKSNEVSPFLNID